MNVGNGGIASYRFADIDELFLSRLICSLEVHIQEGYKRKGKMGRRIFARDGLKICKWRILGIRLVYWNLCREQAWRGTKCFSWASSLPSTRCIHRD